MTMEPEILRRHGWLSGRTPEVQARILEGGRLRSFAPGETVYRVGDTSEGLYGLARGNVTIAIPNTIGSEHTIYQATPGFWIGDLALFSKQRRLVTVLAVSEVEVYFIPQPKLAALVRDEPGMLREFYALSHVNMELQLNILANLSIPNSEKRIAAFLLYSNSVQAEPGAWLETPQDRLATMTALSLPTVQRLVKRLASLGLIEIGYGRIRVQDAEALARYAAE
ncbi:Crp/Fnr family transcriptional regulator [Dinoroseobacter sp. S375]|uniref:Crp/Fnr family transcriptional regulator n=1 Tax=Dinoroseobacter sp. S375 TaxID=3415136 RepID=UPI003C7DD38D